MKQLLLVLGWFAFTAGSATIAAETVPPAAATAVTAPTTVTAPAAVTAPTTVTTPTPMTSGTGAVRVQVTTSMGNFVIELLAERAPLTVSQFLKNVDQAFYSGTLIHRVIPNFVIQGGGFDTTYKLKSAPARVVNESGNGLTNQRGTVGLARSAEPHGGDCQFYVNLFDNAALNPNQTRWGYAVFGRIVQGMDVVDRIGNVATGSKGPFKEDAPLQPVTIERIERVATP